MTPIKFVVGDATQPKTEDQKFIVHIVNNIGKWGHGFVIAVSRRWPEVKSVYCANYHKHELGDIQFVPVDVDLTIVNLFGQDGIRGPGYTQPVRYGAIHAGLKRLTADIKKVLFACSVHMPRIGCGLAGGCWEEIEPLINDTLIKADIPVTVYDLPRRDCNE